MWIFDRWGEAIFYSDDITKGWDGSVKSKSVEDKIDVYAYKVILTDYNNKLHEYVGHVTISK
jgi:gliding motility-associated-like protein